MCLVITAFAAVISTIIWYFKGRNKENRVGLLALMYWGASVMWMVDGFFRIAEGEAFLDLSINDAILGLIIVLCGLAAWVLILICNNPKNLFAREK